MGKSMSIYAVFHAEADAQGLSWTRVCERAGNSRQRVEHALRASLPCSAELVARMADLLGLDRRGILDLWQAECLESSRFRLRWEAAHALEAPRHPPGRGDASLRPRKGGRPRKK